MSVLFERQRLLERVAIVAMPRAKRLYYASQYPGAVRLPWFHVAAAIATSALILGACVRTASLRSGSAS